jgi:hyperosmotically inducible protein
MARSLALRIALATTLGLAALAGIACKEEGKAEKAGRKMDEAFEKLRHGDEGAVERAGRKMGEALEDAGDEIDDALDDAKDDLDDGLDELREKAADAIEGE